MAELEPVAWTSAAQIQRMKEQPSQNHRMWGEPLPYHDDIPLVTLSSAQSAIAERDARIEELERDVRIAVEQRNMTLTEMQRHMDRAEAAEALLKEAMRAMDRCVHDGGFDREIGPIGCSLGDKCVCIGVYPILARSLMSKIGERNGE